MPKSLLSGQQKHNNMSQTGRGNGRGQYRNWCFTLNNPTLTPSGLGSKIAGHPKFKYLVFQAEIGARGTSHYQGYIEFSAALRMNTLKNYIGGNPHLERRMGTRDEARDYCMKDDTRSPGTSPHEYGTFVQNRGSRTDIHEIADAFKSGKRIVDIANEYPSVYVRYHKGLEKLWGLTQKKREEAPTVTLFYGGTGVGKTRTVVNMTDVFKKDGTDQWFDGYAGEEILLIDDFAGKASRITLSFMLNLLDRYQVRLPVKGSFVQLQAKHIFVTTNIHPRLWYDYDKREEHYRALKRRFTDVIYFPKEGLGEEIEVEPKSFWDDWCEFCNEEEVFIPMEQEDDTQPTQVLSMHQPLDMDLACKICGYIGDCICPMTVMNTDDSDSNELEIIE